jgi:hypothetical protein
MAIDPLDCLLPSSECPNTPSRPLGALDEAVDRNHRNPAGEGHRVSQPDRSPRHTTTAQGRLVFHMFGAIAEFERSLIRERTRAGLAAARRAGRTGGRPPKLTDDDIEAAKAMLANPDIGDSNRAPPRRLSGDALSVHPRGTNRGYPERLRTALYSQYPTPPGRLGLTDA